MGRIFAELRRRRVLRTLALYIVGAWGLMQVADVLLPALALPETAMRYLLFAAIAGLPVALVFGWFFDITAEGVQRTRPASEAELADSLPLQRLDYALLVTLLLVLSLIGYGLSDAVMDLPQQASAPSDTRDARDPDAPPMVGVLPFSNLGGEGDGDFFASGVHDDLLTRLAKLTGLRVVSRTSVLGYAGTKKKIPEIGRELRADAILEGGIRVAGDMIRINAQLIDARSDEHLWAETYDRQLTASNIFAVQSEIARAIAGALQTTLSAEESAELAVIPTDNLAAYRIFHETMRWSETVSLHDPENAQRYEDGMRRAFQLDPTFTRPMLELVMRLALGMHRQSQDPETLREVESLIARIGEVAPNSANYYAAQSVYLYYVMQDYDRAEALLANAQKKAPSETRLVEIQSWINRRQGDFEGYLQAARKARDLDPRSARQQSVYVGRLVIMHQYDEAMRELESMSPLSQRDNFNLTLLKLREHHDLDRFARDLLNVLNPLEEQRNPQALLLLWDAQLAARDNDNAQRTFSHLLAMLPMTRREPNGSPLMLMPNDLILGLWRAAVRDNATQTAALVAEARKAMGLEGLMPANYPSHLHPVDRMQLALAEGETETAVELASAYWQDSSVDRAEWLERKDACRILGLAGVAQKTADCLRNLFEEPSNSQPFLEPLMPMYDPIREEPAFKTLVQELASESLLPAPA